MSSKRTDFSSAYKLTRQKENSSTRVKRRSIDWKNSRYEEVSKRRNLDKMSPLQEFGQNLSSSNNKKTHNYDGRTPSKKESSTSTRKTSRKELMLKWREERTLMKQREKESKKEKPSFKVHHVEHSDHNLYNVHSAGSKTANTSKVSTSRKGKTTVRQAKKPSSPPVTRRVTRQMTSTSTKAAEKKNFIQPKLDKVKKATATTKVLKKASYDLDLTKVQTKRGLINAKDVKSFAPSDFTFAAPSSVTSFTFKPLSPASAAEFLCPVNESASTSFFSADPAVGRCSTPMSKTPKNLKKTAGSNSASSNEDVTKYSVSVDNKKVKRRTRQSLRNADLSRVDTLDHVTENTVDEHLLLSGSSDEDVTKYSVVVDGKKIKRSTRKSSHSADAGELDSSGQTTQNAKQETFSASSDEEKAEKPTEYTVIVDGTPVKRGRKSLSSIEEGTSLVTESQNDKANKKTPRRSCRKSINVCTPRRSNRKSMKSVATNPDLETISARNKLAVDDDSDKIFNSSLSCSLKRVCSDDDNSSDTSVVENCLAKDAHNLEESSTQDSATDKTSSSDLEVDEVFSKRRRSSRKTRRSQVNIKNKDTSSDGELQSEVENTAILEGEEAVKKSSPAIVDDRPAVSSSSSMTVEPDVGTEEHDDKFLNCTPIKRSRRKSSSSIETFREPVEPMSVQKSTRKRRKTTAWEIPPEMRSPEEWIQVLAASPMIEMSRRTPKSKTPGKAHLNLIEPINFDDLDDDIAHTSIHISPTPTSTEQHLLVDADSTGVVTSEPATTSDGNHDVLYFRNLLVTETARLNNYCMKWNSVDTADSGIPEESEGQIRTVVGQAQLLMDQRFKQFRGLVDDCEFKRGEKETTCTDLQGFWDMIFFQVEDVDKKFEELQKLKDKNWVVEKSIQTKKTVKRKPIGTKTTKTGGVSKFARFRAEMKKSKQSVQEDTAENSKEFDGGFFKVRSPVKTPVKSPATLDKSSVLSKQPVKTPVRRSYAPCIPSPLLTDITPKRVGRRSVSGVLGRRSLSGTTIQRKLMEEEVECKENIPVSVEKPSSSSEASVPSTSSPAAKTLMTTPRRRSVRLRSTPINEDGDGSDVLGVNSQEMRKYFEPSSVDSPVYSGQKRKSSLKMPPSSAKRRSRHRSVKFSNTSPVQKDQDIHKSLPSTPYNHDSLVARPRVLKGDVLVDIPDSDDLNSPIVKSCESGAKSRPSLLFTPVTSNTITACSSTDLINFSPL